MTIKTTRIEAGTYTVRNLSTGDTYEIFNDREHPAWGNVWAIEKLNGEWVDGEMFDTLREAKAWVGERK